MLGVDGHCVSKDRVYALLYYLRHDMVYYVEEPVSACVAEQHAAIMVNGYTDEYKYAHKTIPNVSCVVVVNFVSVNDGSKGFGNFELLLDISLVYYQYQFLQLCHLEILNRYLKNIPF